MASANPSMTTTVSIVPGHISCDLDGETVVLNIGDGTYYGLNAVGSHIWAQLATPCSVGELRDRVLSEFDVDAARCERDLAALLAELARHSLIELRDA